jgi:hypothetical protein
MAVRTKTFLRMQDGVELRVYVQPFAEVEFCTIAKDVRAEMARVGVNPNPQQLGIFSNRAGLHFYCNLAAPLDFDALLKQHGWRPAKT